MGVMERHVSPLAGGTTAKGERGAELAHFRT
jgi:hypothetical protein